MQSTGDKVQESSHLSWHAGSYFMFKENSHVCTYTIVRKKREHSIEAENLLTLLRFLFKDSRISGIT